MNAAHPHAVLLFVAAGFIPAFNGASNINTAKLLDYRCRASHKRLAGRG
ncbi:hypothetical protein D1AOALGA4SA_3305 [Olavius algarvensis Delta 1 endosymbiont]|nr:hypothetical protein D1AOALGA4SA_3305 [Olavius algarvensis Delta 1 endosymbiont]